MQFEALPESPNASPSERVMSVEEIDATLADFAYQLDRDEEPQQLTIDLLGQLIKKISPNAHLLDDLEAHRQNGTVRTFVETYRGHLKIYDATVIGLETSAED